MSAIATTADRHRKSHALWRVVPGVKPPCGEARQVTDFAHPHRCSVAVSSAAQELGGLRAWLGNWARRHQRRPQSWPGADKAMAEYVDLTPMPHGTGVTAYFARHK